MPNNDRKGPNGEGPRTGRGLGKCGNNNTEENNSNFGQRNGNGCKNGRRNGNGQGRGNGRRGRNN